MRKRDEAQASIPNTLDCGDAAGWALWRLSLVLREIAQNQSSDAGEESVLAASQQTGFEVSSMEGPPDE